MAGVLLSLGGGLSLLLITKAVYPMVRCESGGDVFHVFDTLCCYLLLCVVIGAVSCLVLGFLLSYGRVFLSLGRGSCCCLVFVGVGSFVGVCSFS